MIVRFNKFNENKNTRTATSLKEDVTNAFSYIADDYNVAIQVRLSEVMVEVKSIIPSSTIYEDFEDYVDKSTMWNEVLLDINVAIKQLVSGGDVGHSVKVNTVGNVLIKFHIINDILLTSHITNITISEYNLRGLLNDDNIFSFSKDNCDNNEFLIYFKNSANPAKQIEISEKVKEIFSRYGIDRTEVIITTSPYAVNNLSVIIRKKRDNGDRYKRVKLQNVL